MTETNAQQPETGARAIARLIKDRLYQIGRTHGPRVETYTCPEHVLLPAIEVLGREIAALRTTPAETGGAMVLMPRDPGACENDDSGWILAFLSALHLHLPEDQRPTSWMQFTDEQRERIKGAWRAAVEALASSPPAGDARVEIWRSMDIAPREIDPKTMLAPEKTGLDYSTGLGAPIFIAVRSLYFPGEDVDVIKGCWALNPNNGCAGWWDLEAEEPLDRDIIGWVPLPADALERAVLK